jgi:hypothetical protein
VAAENDGAPQQHPAVGEVAQDEVAGEQRRDDLAVGEGAISKAGLPPPGISFPASRGLHCVSEILPRDLSFQFAETACTMIELFDFVAYAGASPRSSSNRDRAAGTCHQFVILL